MNERWRSVAGWPQYEVSSEGRVRRVVPDSRNHACRLLRPHIGSHGYEAVTLQEGGKRARCLVHRLVCEAFHGPAPTPLHQAAHGDGTRRNNRPENLRWATRSENMEDARAHGTLAMGRRHGRTLSPHLNPRGERHGHAKLSEAEVAAIRAEPRFKGSGRVLAGRYGVSPATISIIRNGKTWKHSAGKCGEIA